MSRALTTNLRGLALTTPFILHLFIADLILSLLLPLKPLLPTLVYNTSSAIASSVWSSIQRIFTRSNGARITVSGDPLPPNESAVVVSNHVAWADFYMIQALAQRSGMLGRCRYFAKKQLRLVPFLGWGLWAMGMPMVSRNWLRDRGELERIFSKTVRHQLPVWLVNFSEATRFTPEKHAQSLAFCQQNSRPQPKHLLYPRTKGFITTVQQLRSASHVRAVYDLTIAYGRQLPQAESQPQLEPPSQAQMVLPEQPAITAVTQEVPFSSGGGRSDFEWQVAPSMWDTLSVPSLSDDLGYKFHVHARRFPIESLPESDEELAKWLEERWVEKGEWLEEKRREWASEGVVVTGVEGMNENEAAMIGQEEEEEEL